MTQREGLVTENSPSQVEVDGFKQGGFSGAVFTGEEGDAGVGEVEGGEGLNGGDVEGIDVGGVAGLEGYGGEHGCGYRAFSTERGSCLP